MPYILFNDTNVILDDILNRMPAAGDCKQIFSMAEKGNILIYTSPSRLTTVIYILQRYRMPNNTIVQILEQILKVYRLASPDKSNMIASLHAGFNDLEDAIQYSTNNKRCNTLYCFKYQRFQKYLNTLTSFVANAVFTVVQQNKSYLIAYLENSSIDKLHNDL